MTIKETLIAAAFEAKKKSYSPYSSFCVGAAILTESEKIYSGCNVENASYGGTICAERTAALHAVFGGERRFAAIAVAGASKDSKSTDSFAYPCGICRQFLREFALPNMKVYVAASPEDVLECTLEEMLPHSFGPENLK